MIPFTKAHACGNDFLIVTEEAAADHDWANLARQLCARNRGVGADGVEFFAWTGGRSGRIRLHNADGSVAEISGNGTRCVAAWMAEATGAKRGDDLQIETDAGLRVCTVNAVNTAHGYAIDVRTGMGIPSVNKKTVRLSDGTEIDGAEISTGNPHFVILANDAEFAVAGKAWQTLGKEICFHADFPKQTNVEFIRIVSPRQIEIRIFERGVGPTTSSGTGSSASATAAIALHGSKSPLEVVAPGGPQAVEWNGEGNELYLTGPASLIARGEAWEL